MFFIPIFCAIGFGVFLLIADGLCSFYVKKSYKKLETYQHKEARLGSGIVTYVDKGKGETILSVHGICGGYDQGFDAIRNMASGYRIIAPSRFGYLGSEMPEDPSPKAQAKVFAELLDELEIDKAYLLATSAGGTTAIRFALDYPEKTKGLILYSSAAPLKAKPKHYAKYAGPPRFLCNNYGMWMASLFFKPAMGIDRLNIYSMLPIADRREGIINDASVTNPDMARNFDDYPIEDIHAPALIFQAKDDKLARYGIIEQSVSRFPDCKFVVFEKGGHMLVDCAEKLNEELNAFLKQTSVC